VADWWYMLLEGTARMSHIAYVCTENWLRQRFRCSSRLGDGSFGVYFFIATVRNSGVGDGR